MAEGDYKVEATSVKRGSGGVEVFYEVVRSGVMVVKDHDLNAAREDNVGPRDMVTGISKARLKELVARKGGSTGTPPE